MRPQLADHPANLAVERDVIAERALSTAENALRCQMALASLIRSRMRSRSSSSRARGKAAAPERSGDAGEKEAPELDRPRRKSPAPPTRRLSHPSAKSRTKYLI